MKWFERALYWLALATLAVWVHSIDGDVGISLAIGQVQANINQMQLDVAYSTESRLHTIEGLLLTGPGSLTFDEYNAAVNEHWTQLASIQDKEKEPDWMHDDSIVFVDNPADDIAIIFPEDYMNPKAGQAWYVKDVGGGSFKLIAVDWPEGCPLPEEVKGELESR